MTENEKALRLAEDLDCIVGCGQDPSPQSVTDATAHVRRLAAENERLRGAAVPFAAEWEKYRAAFRERLGREPADGEERNVFSPDRPLISDCRRLAAALGATP